MKHLLLVILMSVKLFSQEIVEPVEYKSRFLRNNPNYGNYVFKDVNNVLGKFCGKWVYMDGTYIIDMEIIEFYDANNQQDAVYIILKVAQGDDILVDAVGNSEFSYINGGFFEDDKNLNQMIVVFSEISDRPICGNASVVTLTYKNESLNWEIEPMQLHYNKTASLFPSDIIFKRL
jgi:hypothetical protein